MSRGGTDSAQSTRYEDNRRDQLAAIAANTTDTFLTVDRSGTIRFANEASRELLGYQPTVLEGESLLSIIPERHRSDHRAAFTRFLETGERTMAWRDLQLAVVTADGDEVPVSVSFSEFGSGEEHRFVGILRDVSARAEMEAALRRSEARFRQLAEELDSVIWMTDPEKTQMLYVNPAYETVWGRSIDDLYEEPTSFIETIHPDDRDRVEAAIERQPTGGYDEEYRILRPDGEVRWVRDRAVPVEDDAGEVYRIIGIAADVTERKRRERELEQTIERVTDAIVRVDAEWRFTFVDDRAAEIYDMAAAELIGRDFWDVFSTALGTRFEREYREAMASRQPTTFEAYYGFLDGWFRVNVFPDEDGGLSFYFRDITERKEYERELEFRTALLEGQAEATIDGLIVVDTDRRIIQYNQRFLDIWDLDEGFIQGRPTGETVIDRVIDRVADPEAFTADLEYLWDNPDAERRDEIELADGRWLDRYTAPVVGQDGTHYGRLWVFRDVTDRREHERALETHKRRLETFASFVSHDLRNPLNVAEGRLQLARETADSDHLVEVERALDRMRSLIDDLLGLARANEAIGDLVPVDLTDVVDECWDTVSSPGTTITVESSRTVLADRSRLVQVFENLFRNAVEHGGEAVTVTVGALDDGFYVEDDGPGVPPADRDRVFDSGVTTQRDGTGFGLAIVERIADAHGWSVTLTEGTDGGARFEFTGVESP